MCVEINVLEFFQSVQILGLFEQELWGFVNRIVIIFKNHSSFPKA